MIKKILSFGIVGIIATAIDFISLFIFKTGLHVDVYIATTVAFILSLTFNYIASMKYVFIAKKELTIFKQSIIFLITALIGLLINQGVMFLCIEYLNIYYMLAKLLATAIVMIFNFVARHKLLEN